MHTRIYGLLLALGFWSAACIPVVAQPAASLWYGQPAGQWTEALPLGNGRLAAMVFGGTNTERIQLNEETIWAGTRVDDLNPAARGALQQVRDLLFAGKNTEAYNLVKTSMLGTPPEIRSYQTLGDLFIRWTDTAGNISSCARRLSLDSATHSTWFRRIGAAPGKPSSLGGQSFISAPADMLVARYASSDGGLGCRIMLARQEDVKVTVSGNRILMIGQLADSGQAASKGPEGLHLRFAAVAEIRQEGGVLRADGDCIEVRGAKAVEIRLTAASDYDYKNLSFDRDIDPVLRCTQILDRSSNSRYADLLKAHLAEYQPKYRKFSFRLDGPGLDALPTDKRLARLKAGESDPGLLGRQISPMSGKPTAPWRNSCGPCWNRASVAPPSCTVHGDGPCTM